MGGPPSGVGPSMSGPMGTMGPMGQSGQMRTPTAPKTASDLLTANSKLSSHLASTLGVNSATLLSDASGFKNLGLFVAAMHVSKNLNIPFSDLSSALQKNGNLGKAIHNLNPNLSKKQVKSAVRTAKHQAKTDIHSSKG